MSALQIKNPHHIERLFEHLGLMFVAWNAVQYERVLLRAKSARFGTGIDKLAPQPNGGFVGYQFASARVLQEYLAHATVVFHAAEDIAARAMEEVRNGAQNLARSR